MQKTLFLLVFVLLMVGTAAGSNVTVEVLDENSDRLNSQLTLKQDGVVIADSSGFLEENLVNGENYTLIQDIESGPEVRIYNFSISQDFDFKPILYANQNPEQKFLAETDPLYYVNQEIDFSVAQIATDRQMPDSIAKCLSIVSSECDSWVVDDISKYPTSYSGSTFRYNVSTFSGYTTGLEAPLPKLDNIKIYDVSDSQDKRTGGSLVDEGINKSFSISQQNSTQYRFTFNVSNQGSETWFLTSSDILQHKGLNQSWEINDTNGVFYKINQTIYDGGTVSNGKVTWNAGNGGEIPVNGTIQPSYVVNVTQDSTNTFMQVFNVTTASNTGDIDYHQLRTLIYGFINVSIQNPGNNSVVQNNRVFSLNGSVNCFDGDCGEITAIPRRNGTGGQELFTGSIFEILDQNNTCYNLLEGSSCDVEWTVNATGNPNTFHEIDIQASSNYSQISSNNTKNNIVEIRDILMLELDWDVVNFGVLDPGDEKNPAKNNTQGYNMTIPADSNSIDNLWVKASKLVSEQNKNYSIGPGNMSWSEENSYAASNNFTEDYSLIDTNLKPETTKTLFYWLNVPFGITNRGYTGTMTFKVNQS